MASFAIYQYLFGNVEHQEAPGTLHLDLGEDKGNNAVTLSNADKQKIFGKIFEDIKELQFVESDAQEKPFPYKIIPCEENKNVIILRIAAHKKKSFEQNFTDISVDWNPSTLVIIDNRKDIQRIAILVKNNAFSTQRVANMLQRVLSEHLKNDRLTLEITPKRYSGDFWKVAARHKGRIHSVKFGFTREYLKDIKRVTPHHESGPVTQLLEGLEGIAETMNADPSLVTKAAEKSLEINQTDAQMQALVKVCAATGQPICVHTLDGIKYNCYLLENKDSEEEKELERIVVQEFDDEIVKNFMNADDYYADDLFYEEHRTKDMLALITFMNSLKYAYD